MATDDRLKESADAAALKVLAECEQICPWLGNELARPGMRTAMLAAMGMCFIRGSTYAAMRIINSPYEHQTLSEIQ
jgi:hypothetical protein